jgi:hypothetical protein
MCIRLFYYCIFREFFVYSLSSVHIYILDFTLHINTSVIYNMISRAKKISVRLSSPTLNNRSGVALAYPLFFNTAWIVSSSTSSCLLHHHVIRLIFYEDLWPGLCFSTRWELPLAKASVAVPPRPGCCL